jgi:carbon storage regulator
VLVLSRKPGESVRIGDDVVVCVIESGHGQVRVGIEAPSAVRVLREEIYQAIAGANSEAAGSIGPPPVEAARPKGAS